MIHLVCTTHPTRSGCRFRWSRSGAQYWVSNPHRGPVRFFVREPPKLLRQDATGGVWRERWRLLDSDASAGALADLMSYRGHDGRHPQLQRLLAELHEQTTPTINTPPCRPEISP